MEHTFSATVHQYRYRRDLMKDDKRVRVRARVRVRVRVRVSVSVSLRV